MDKIKAKVKALETIDQVYDQIEKLNQRRDTLNASLKQSYDKQLDSLNRRKQELKGKLAEMESASEENWNEVKEALSVSLDHYKAGFQELKKIFQ
jgi:chromosome segregation ATPase